MNIPNHEQHPCWAEYEQQMAARPPARPIGFEQWLASRGPTRPFLAAVDTALPAGWQRGDTHLDPQRPRLQLAYDPQRHFVASDAGGGSNPHVHAALKAAGFKAHVVGDGTTFFVRDRHVAGRRQRSTPAAGRVSP